MKINKYIPILGLFLLGAAVVITSCNKEDDYDFSKVEPGKTAITGPETVYTGFDFTFSATIRGGSTYNWEKVSGDYTVVGDGYNATVSSTAANDGTGVLKCTETTQGGIVGIPDTISFAIAKFCAFDINTFTGAYTCDETGYGAYGVGLTIDPDNENAVLNDNFWDWAAAGEVIRYEFSGDVDQIVTVPLQDFVYGDGSAGTVEGSGTYDGCTGTMHVEYNVVYDGADNATVHDFSPGAPAKKSFIKKGN